MLHIKSMRSVLAASARFVLLRYRPAQCWKQVGACFLAAAFGLMNACGGSRSITGGKRIQIVMKDAGGVRRGTSVYLQGVRIGDAEAPCLESRVVMVTIALNGQAPNDVLPCTEFVVRADPAQADRLALIGLPPSELPEAPKCASGLYVGYPSESARVGAKAGEILDLVKSLLH